MNGYIDELESLLDDMDFGEYEEAARRSPRSQVRTPSRQSSFMPRQTTTPASQTQVQAAARNLDGKIETLTNAVKALETRANTMSAEQDKTTSALGKEITARKKGSEAIRGDLQQTKLLSILLPQLTQETVPATGAQGQQLQVVTQSQNQFASILPFLLLMGGSSGDSTKGPLGDQTTTLLFLLLLSRK